MENPCHRCGAPVEEGTRFCPACSAPQIRVLRPLPEAPVEPRPWQAPEDFAPPETARPAAVFQWQHAWPAVMFAGAAMGALSVVLSALPLLNFLFPIWMILAGTLAVSFYLRRSGAPTLPAAFGARLGALAGLLAFAVFSLFAAGSLLLFGFAEVREQVRQTMVARMPSPADPQTQALMEKLLSPQGLTILFIFGMALFLVGFVLLGTAAGAFWARRRSHRAR